MNVRVQEEAPYRVGAARYAKGMMAVRCTAPGPYKDRAQRLIGDGLRCRWSGRERAYIASPSKVAKFEALYAAGFDACSFSGAIHQPGSLRDGLTVAEAMRELRQVAAPAEVGPEPAFRERRLPPSVESHGGHPHRWKAEGGMSALGHNGAPQPRARRTGVRSKAFRWACGYVVPGETEIRVPVYGEPYTAPRTVEFYGSTRLQAIRAYEAATGFRVGAA